MGVHDTDRPEWRWRLRGRMGDEEEGNGVEKSEDPEYEEHSRDNSELYLRLGVKYQLS